MKRLISLDDLLDKIEDKLGYAFEDIADDYDTGYVNGISAVISIIHNMSIIESEEFNE